MTSGVPTAKKESEGTYGSKRKVVKRWGSSQRMDVCAANSGNEGRTKKEDSQEGRKTESAREECGR